MSDIFTCLSSVLCSVSGAEKRWKVRKGVCGWLCPYRLSSPTFGETCNFSGHVEVVKVVGSGWVRLL